MVNNAVAQPEESGYTYTLLGVKQDTAKAKADSGCLTFVQLVEREYWMPPISTTCSFSMIFTRREEPVVGLEGPTLDEGQVGGFV